MTKTRTLWGGRFTSSPDETFARFNNSFSFDKRLFAADMRASLAHLDGLYNAGVLTKRDASKIRTGLKTLLKQANFDGDFFDGSDAEDVHSFIESKLIQIIGDTGKKLHTGRSRNDQVATAFRLWLRDEIDQTAALVAALQKALLDAADRHKKAVLPGYTHLQRAQPVLWAHW
jgi:argininosuccinate lyase